MLLADSAKLGMRGAVRICGAEELDALVTDVEAPAAICDELRAAGVEVIRA